MIIIANQLYNLVQMSQNGDTEACLEIIRRFKPLIKKYGYKLGYDDAYSDLILELIEVVYKLPIKRNNSVNSDKYIIGYINSSIKHKYIYLSKKYKRIYKIEVPLNLDITAKDLNESVESKVFIDNLMEIVPASVEIARRPFARFWLCQVFCVNSKT